MIKRRYLGWDIEQEKAKARRVIEIRDQRFLPNKKHETQLAVQHVSHALLMNTLYRFQTEGLYCDVMVLTGDNGQFVAHRIVLSATSQYFRTLFTTSLNSRELSRCMLPNIRASSMEQIILYSYYQRVTITKANVMELLVAADFLGIVDVLRLCCDYVAHRLMPGNCIRVLHFARNFKDKLCIALADSAYRYVMTNFVSVSLQSKELLELNEDELKLIISADELNVDNEEYVWECILRWIRHDFVNRRKSMESLLPHIRFGVMDPDFFLEQVRKHPWVSGPECRNFVIETLKYISNLDYTNNEIGRPRVSHEMLFAIGGWSDDQPTNQIEVYDCRMERWMIVDHVDPEGPRAYHGTAVVSRHVYVLGGFDGKLQYYSSCRRYDTACKTWHEVAPMNCRRCYVSVAVVGESVYAMGGYDGHYRQNTAERLDTADNQWSLIPPMHDQRSDASATALNGRVYIVGGFNGLECVTSAEMYEPDTAQWTVIQPMANRRSGVGCIAYHGLLYAIGGFNGTTRLGTSEKYDPATNKWLAIPTMKHPRSNFGIGVIDNMLIVVGGFNGVSTFPDVECYDDINNVWYRRSSMSICRSALSACVLEGLPNVCSYIHDSTSKNCLNRSREKLLDLPISENANVDLPCDE